MSPIPRRALILATATLALVVTGTLRSQPLDARTVNLEGTWTPLAHDLHFAFAHRFEIETRLSFFVGAFSIRRQSRSLLQRDYILFRTIVVNH